jgi:hypothetical protein
MRLAILTFKNVKFLFRLDGGNLIPVMFPPCFCHFVLSLATCDSERILCGVLCCCILESDLCE